MTKKEKNINEIKIPIEIEHYEKKIFDLKQLIDISIGLSSTLEYNTLIDSILLTCMGQMQLLNAGIFLSKGIGYNNFTLHRNYKGFELDHSMEYEISYDSELVKFFERAYGEKETVCFTLQETESNVKSDDSFKVLKMLNPLLIIALFNKGDLNGIIILAERINNDTFTEAEKDYLKSIASLAGVAINNAKLYEMATTDMMTNLKIHHYFQAALIEEIDRAVKYKRPLSLIMADIDYFKKFNDTYGHTAGDAVLKAVARVIKQNIRPTDIPARYGGEEFSVILPRTDIHESLIVAERIRHSVEKEIVHHENKELCVTISIGITQFDSNTDKAKNDLIGRADKALYVSKKNGRNQVSFL